METHDFYRSEVTMDSCNSIAVKREWNYRYRESIDYGSQLLKLVKRGVLDHI